MQPIGRFLLMYSAISLVLGYWVLSRVARVPF
jgi:Flp pilus assembly protein TadB